MTVGHAFDLTQRENRMSVGRLQLLMRHVSFALLFLTASSAWSQDPLHSPQCDAARAVLEKALDEGSRAQVDAARKEAIGACLGSEDPDRARSGAPERPVVVPAPRFPAAPAVVATPVPPPIAIPRPSVVTTCDPGGCWDSEGHRLNQVGPVLVGPRGACTVQGGIVVCP